jgi:hypothetical protein
MRKGQSEVTFTVHSVSGSPSIAGWQWHITNGQSEAVGTLEFDGKKFVAKDFPLPLPGGRHKMQTVKSFRNLTDLTFKFSGAQTKKGDPKNPFWMGRILGIKQEVVWGKPMRGGDCFNFELRDQPWQPGWQVPSTIPWFEGMLFVRKPFLEGDTLTYRMGTPAASARRSSKTTTRH